TPIHGETSRVTDTHAQDEATVRFKQRILCESSDKSGDDQQEKNPHLFIGENHFAQNFLKRNLPGAFGRVLCGWVAGFLINRRKQREHKDYHCDSHCDVDQLVWHICFQGLAYKACAHYSPKQSSDLIESDSLRALLFVVAVGDEGLICVVRKIPTQSIQQE